MNTNFCSYGVSHYYCDIKFLIFTMKITATTVYFLKKPPVLLDLVQKGTLTTISKPNTSTSTNMIKDSSSSTKDDL